MGREAYKRNEAKSKMKHPSVSDKYATFDITDVEKINLYLLIISSLLFKKNTFRKYNKQLVCSWTSVWSLWFDGC